MSIRLEIPLPNLLPVIRLLLVHPRLTRVGQRPPGTLPVQVLALVGPLVAGAVLQARVTGDEVVGPLLGVGDEFGVPD